MPVHNSAALWSRIKSLLPGNLRLQNPSSYLSGNREGRKAVIRFFESGDSAPAFVLKGSPTNGEGREELDSESRVLTFLQARFAEERDLGFSAPAPIRSFDEAGWHYTMETAAAGHPLSELIFLRSRRGRLDILRNELSRCAEVAAKMSHALEGSAAPLRTDSSWYEIPPGVNLSPDTAAAVRSEAKRWAQEKRWAHGDFTIENVFWERSSGNVSVIDWELPMQGVPPLYDAFTLLFSSLSALALDIPELTGSDNRLERQFHAAFFSTGPWAEATREILKRISGDEAEIWLEMLLSLVIRTNYFRWRQPALGVQYSGLLRFTVEHEESFVCRVRAR